MASSTRKQAPRLAKPAIRYWKGKAPKGLTEVKSDSVVEEETSDFEEGTFPLMIMSYPLRHESKHHIWLLPFNIGRRTWRRPRLKLIQAQTLKKEPSNFEEGDIPIISGQSSEYESDSDMEPQVEFRPVFIPIRARATIAEREIIAQGTDEASKERDGRRGAT